MECFSKSLVGVYPIAKPLSLVYGEEESYNSGQQSQMRDVRCCR